MTISAARPVTIKIDVDIRERLTRLAAARQRTAQWLIREAISQYVTREEKREAFREDGFNALNECQSTGQHVSFQEADTWLAKLESGVNDEPPQCHD